MGSVMYAGSCRKQQNCSRWMVLELIYWFLKCRKRMWEKGFDGTCMELNCGTEMGSLGKWFACCDGTVRKLIQV